MALQTGHIRGTPEPRRLLREWFRPMFPEIYGSVAVERLTREECRGVIKGGAQMSSTVVWDSIRCVFAWANPFLAIIFVIWFTLAYILA